MNKIRTSLEIAGRWIGGHKKLSVAIVAAVVLGGLWAASRSSGSEDAYVFGVVRRGDIVSTVTGSGQVEALDRVDLKSEVSGDVTRVYVKPGDVVRKGDLLAFVDDSDARKEVANAELAVANAEISYKAAQKKHADQADSSQVSDLKLAYEAGYTAISGAFIDMPAILLDVGNVFYDPERSPYFSDYQVILYAGSAGAGYRSQAGVLFDAARKAYDAQFSRYKSLTVDSDPKEIEGFLTDANDILRKLSAALSATYSAVDYVNTAHASSGSKSDALQAIASDKSKLNSYLSSVNSHLSAVSKAITGIESAKDSRSETEVALKSAELKLSEARDSLDKAKKKLSNHAIRSTIDGTVAKVDVEAGKSITANAAVATIVSDQKVVTIVLNEIDAAKVATGQKATLTFDAVDGLVANGVVSEVDLLGTVTQGVVSYSMKISFDVEDPRIKPGMTTNASIAIASKDGVLTVSSSAIKSMGGRSYVEAVGRDAAISRAFIETGVSSDDLTEVISGLAEGDRYVVRTISVSSANRSTGAANQTLFGGGTVRATTGGTSRGAGGAQGQPFVMPR